ncbi:MAG: PD40 domain-containing protein [Bacteroidia bacterium]|nr:PD40 domain-containing protein [Bacteroidia bacterium]
MTKKLVFLSLFVAVIMLQMPAFAQKFNAKQTFINAQKHMQLGETQLAIEDLLLYFKNDSTNSNVNYLLGSCYFKTDATKSQCIPYLLKATEINPEYQESNAKENKASPEALWILALAQYKNSMFDNALTSLEKYKEFVKTDVQKSKDAEKMISLSNNAKELIKNPVKISLINMGAVINSELDDHSPVFNIDETVMIFTSKRKGSTGNFKTSDKQYFEDIYISRKENSQWGAPQKISENINTMEHEASVALSADGNDLIIYKDDVGDGNLYLSHFNGTEWAKPEKLSSNVNSSYDESHASISSDGSTLYFSSNRPGGLGGYDLYISYRLPNGDWSLAKNAGSIINTEKDESGPFIHPDGSTLYFSSKGHNSMGGYDLFFTILKDDGAFSRPENMGYPINSIDDDVFYVLSADGKRAYYSTVQKEGVGGKDIYLMDLLSLPERALVVVNGFIKNKKTGEVVKDVILKINDFKTGTLIGEFKPNRQSGKYTIVLPKSKQYTLSCNGCGLTFPTEPLSIPDNSSFYYLQKPIVLDPIVEVE